jgi:TrpR family transcriptional regulator, trp operon repressor
MNTNQENLTELIDLLLKATTHDDMALALQEILTPAELRDIPKRLQIMKLLEQGLPQREIAKRLGVGIATVTRGSKELQARTKTG